MEDDKETVEDSPENTSSLVWDSAIAGQGVRLRLEVPHTGHSRDVVALKE